MSQAYRHWVNRARQAERIRILDTDEPHAAAALCNVRTIIGIAASLTLLAIDNRGVPPSLPS
jgi:hypothetical protein